MTTQSKVISILVILALGFLVYISRDMKTISPIQISNPNLMTATFVWETGPSNAVNLDGQPKTNIYVKATYANGVVERKLVEVETGCNELPEAERDGAVYQCYAAGTGFKYKIIKGENSYLVQRKKFEEALPKQKAKKFEYETIVEFTPTK